MVSASTTPSRKRRIIYDFVKTYSKIIVQAALQNSIETLRRIGSATFIQFHWRTFYEFRINQKLNASNRMKRCFLMHLRKKRNNENRLRIQQDKLRECASTIICNSVRRMLSQNLLKRLIINAHQQQQMMINDAVSLIQKKLRSFISVIQRERQLERELHRIQHLSARTIQIQYKRILTKKEGMRRQIQVSSSIIYIQKFMRGSLCRRKMARLNIYIVQVQSWWRLKKIRHLESRDEGTHPTMRNEALGGSDFLQPEQVDDGSKYQLVPSPVTNNAFIEDEKYCKEEECARRDLMINEIEIIKFNENAHHDFEDWRNSNKPDYIINMEKRNRYALIVQKCFRDYRNNKLKHASLVIVYCIKRFLFRKKARQLLQRQHNAIVLIQSMMRSHLAKTKVIELHQKQLRNVFSMFVLSCEEDEKNLIFNIIEGSYGDYCKLSNSSPPEVHGKKSIDALHYSWIKMLPESLQPARGLFSFPKHE